MNRLKPGPQIQLAAQELAERFRRQRLAEVVALLMTAFMLSPSDATTRIPSCYRQQCRQTSTFRCLDSGCDTLLRSSRLRDNTVAMKAHAHSALCRNQQPPAVFLERLSG